MSQTQPRIGIGIYLIRDDKILLGKRIGAHGSHTWSPPGGHLHFGETPEQCAQRELFEETGIQATEFQRGPWTHDFFQEEGKHYITLALFATSWEGNAHVMEPEKCVCWDWFPTDALPTPLFLSVVNLFHEYRRTSK